MLKPDDKTVSLVLGSGGARGLAHIGVIHWLEDNGYDIKDKATSYFTPDWGVFDIANQSLYAM